MITVIWMYMYSSLRLITYILIITIQTPSYDIAKHNYTVFRPSIYIPPTLEQDSRNNCRL
jgi:hypothetical protein